MSFIVVFITCFGPCMPDYLDYFFFFVFPLEPVAPKRELEDNDGPAAKVPKTENGS